MTVHVHPPRRPLAFLHLSIASHYHDVVFPVNVNTSFCVKFCEGNRLTSIFYTFVFLSDCPIGGARRVPSAPPSTAIVKYG
jgi:hypothetical protein